LKIATIHVDPLTDLADQAVENSDQHAIRLCIVGALLVALKDRATSVCHTDEPGHSGLSYEIDGQWQELATIPELLAPLVSQTVRSWINPSGFRRSMASILRRLANRFDPSAYSTLHYPIMLVVNPIWSIWGVTIQTMKDDRSRVTFELLECTDWAREQVSRILETLSSETQSKLIEMNDAEVF
jgi:hypothetical protein